MNSFKNNLSVRKNPINLVGKSCDACDIEDNERLEPRERIPAKYEKVIDYFKSRMRGSRVEILGTFSMANTLYFSDLDCNLYTNISSIDELYNHLRNLGDTGDTGYIYSDLKIGTEHFTAKELLTDKLAIAVNGLFAAPKLIKHDIIFYDGDLFREASFFLIFNQNSYLKMLNVSRDIVGSLRASFIEEFTARNYMKAIKRLLSLSKARGNQLYVPQLLYYIDSEYNRLSMIISSIECLGLVKLALDPSNPNIPDAISNVLFMFESIRIKGLMTVPSVKMALISMSDSEYVRLVDTLKRQLNNSLAENMACKKINLMLIFKNI